MKDYYKYFKELDEKLENDPEYILEGGLLNITEQVYRLMEEQNISKAQLAKRLGKNQAYVTRMLNGHNKLTVETIVKTIIELGGKPKIIIEEV